MDLNVISIRLLDVLDVDKMFEFEVANRAWFERYIESRGDVYYTYESIADEVHADLNRYKKRQMHPVVIEYQDKIIGRANIRGINETIASANVGYRISEKWVGEGIGKLALNHLILVAREKYALAELTAIVAKTNQASLRLLIKCGFVIESDAQSIIVSGLRISCVRCRKHL